MLLGDDAALNVESCGLQDIYYQDRESGRLRSSHSVVAVARKHRAESGPAVALGSAPPGT
jgi:hypothetical protein